MPFPTSKVSSAALRLVDNPWFTLKCSTYLAYLFEMRTINQTQSHPWRHPKYRRFLLSRLLYYSLVLVYILRGVYIVYLLYNWGHAPIGTTHLYVDPLFSLFILYFGGSLNAFTSAVCTLFPVFFIAIDYALSFALDAFIVTTLRQLTLLNSERFFALNGHLQVPKLRLLNPLDTLTKGRAWLREMWSPSKDSRLTFAHAHLEAFPNLSGRTRARLVLLTLLAELGCAGMSALLAVTTIGVLITFLSMVIAQYGPLHVFTLVCLVDSFVIIMLIFHNATNLNFTLYGVSLPLLLTRFHTEEMNQSLKQLLERLEKAQNSPKLKKPTESEITARNTRRAAYLSRLEATLRRQLTIFYAEHRRLQYIQTYLNDKVASNLLLISFLIGVLIQIVLSNIWLLQKELTLPEKVVYLFFVANISGVFLQISRVTVAWTEALYSAVGLLYKAQSLLMVRPETTPGRGPYFARGQNFAVISAKLHLMKYFELLCTNDKLLFTVGQLGSISKFSLYEFFYGYTGFFMFITQFMQDLSGTKVESADGYSLLM